VAGIKRLLRHPPVPGRLDRGIEKAVRQLQACGIETFESCEGGEGHGLPGANSPLSRANDCHAASKLCSELSPATYVCGAFFLSFLAYI